MGPPEPAKIASSPHKLLRLLSVDNTTISENNIITGFSYKSLLSSFNTSFSQILFHNFSSIMANSFILSFFYSVAASTVSLLPSVEPSPTSSDSVPDSFFLGLEVWEVGLVGANALAVFVLLLCALTATVYVCRRKPPQSSGDDHKMIPLKELVEIEEDADNSSQSIT